MKDIWYSPQKNEYPKNSNPVMVVTDHSETEIAFYKSENKKWYKENNVLLKHEVINRHYFTVRMNLIGEIDVH